MEPEEENYEIDVDQINVTEVYEKFIQILSKPKVQRYKHGKLLNRQIEELYQLFCEENGIKPDFSHYNRNRYSIISQSDKRWFTWFNYKILTFTKAQIPFHLDKHYSIADDKNKFMKLIGDQTMNFIGGIEIPGLEEKIREITRWAEKKKDLHSNVIWELKPGDNRLIPNKGEIGLRDYFQQLVDDLYMDQDQVDHLIQANFKYGEFIDVKKFTIEIDDSHLIYFIHHFFKRYTPELKNPAMRTSKFLTTNFTNFIEQSEDLHKEATWRGNFRNKVPKKYPFRLT
jgi:hypothetical protein